MKKIAIAIPLLVVICLGIATASASAPALPSVPETQVTLTSITIDPENSTGQTTNAPGAWSTNTGDPLIQVGVKSGGTYLNQPIGDDPLSLGEISIPLHIGLNTFSLVGNLLLPDNEYYGAVLFFNGRQVHPQIAVYNQNGGTGKFMVQPTVYDTEDPPMPVNSIMGGANGGWFFDIAPGTSSFVTDDGLTVEVKSFTINAVTSTTDEVSAYHIGADGENDMTAILEIIVTPKANVAVQNIIDQIPSLDLPSQVQNPLTAKLQNILTSMNTDKLTTALNQLSATINYIQAQTDKKIPIEQSEYLISELQTIMQEIQV